MLIDRFSQACEAFGLTINQKKMHATGQNTDSPPDVRLPDQALDVVHDFV